MSSEPKRTSRARPLPISRGSRAMGPPPATSPTPTSHCDRSAFSRLAKLMSQASAISLPFPLAGPRVKGHEADGQGGYPDHNFWPRLQSRRPLRHAGQILHIGVEITVVQEKSFNGTVEDYDL